MPVGTAQMKGAKRPHQDGEEVASNGFGSNLPDFKDMPAVPGMPHGCAWGLFDKKGKKDEFGTLNLLTPDVVTAARLEIQEGVSVAINWSQDNCKVPHSGRIRPEHRIVRLPDWTGHDDEVTMNTQSGSQWDGFRRYNRKYISRRA